MITLLSYATPEFKKSQRLLERSALKFGVEKVLSYGPSDIMMDPFYHKHQQLFKVAKGAGLWLWKPYLINRELSSLKENEVLIYCDAGIEVVSDLTPLFKLLEKNPCQLMLFQAHTHLNRKFIKRDCFILMEADSEIHYNAQQCMGGFIVLKKNDFTIAFVGQWLDYATDARILSDQPNTLGLPNLPEFTEHRHDQAILSLMASKNNLEVYRDPSQWGNHYKMPGNRKPDEFLAADYDTNPWTNSPYDTLLFIHKNQKPDIKLSLRHLTLRLKKKLIYLKRKS